jgi:hypothetical protein
MFNRKTVFVVGAGAGFDIGMPIGTKLAEIVADKVNVQTDEFGKHTRRGDANLLSIASGGDRSKLAALQAAGRIIAGGIQLTNSIDDFLHLHQGNSEVVRIGKVAIVRAILESEKASPLFIDPSNIYNRMDLTKLSKTWYVKFMRILSKEVPLKSVDSIFKNVSFITFNYDRCIEHFLINALSPLYGITQDHARKLCESVVMHHAYGSVGSLPGWKSDLGAPVGFGGYNADVSALANSIRTYTETARDQQEIEAIRATVSQAEVMVFLGFGFHQPNMRLLSPGRQVKAQVFAMAYQCSQLQRDLALDDIGGMLQAGTWARDPLNVRIRADLDCPAMFDEFGRLMAS